VYDEQIALLENQLDEQAQRRDELQTRSIYVTTKQFIEEFAREKLGLVYEDELIFRPQDK
jgi:cell division protein DivIC